MAKTTNPSALKLLSRLALAPMNSFDCLLKIYPEAYTEEERAQTFLWYYLRRHPYRKTAHVKTIQKYFRRADRRVPSVDLIRRALLSYPKPFPPGSAPDTFALN